LGLELAYLEQVEAEGLDLSQDAVHRGLVRITYRAGAGSMKGSSSVLRRRRRRDEELEQERKTNRCRSQARKSSLKEQPHSN